MRSMLKLVEHHGKGGCDGNSVPIAAALSQAIKDGRLGPEPGPRNMVLFLAINRPEPSTPKAQKRGWEAIGRIFYGYMDFKLFTKWAMPDADGAKFEGSKSCSFFCGM